MPNSRRSWSESAATSGFHVSQSPLLHHWRHAVVSITGVAALIAPVGLMITLALLLVPVCAARRLSLMPLYIDCDWFSLDLDSGGVSTLSDGQPSQWQLNSWFRHPGLCVLYLRGKRRDSAVLILPRDCLNARAHRRLYYLLGVSTVGAGSGSLSG